MLAGLKDREAQRDTLRAELERLARAPVVSGLEPSVIVGKVQAKLAECRALLGRQTVISRQIVRKAMVGRVTVRVDGKRTIIEGIGTLKGLFGGELLSQGLASPMMESSHPQVPSWTDVAADLDSMRKLAGLLRSAA